MLRTTFYARPAVRLAAFTAVCLMALDATAAPKKKYTTKTVSDGKTSYVLVENKKGATLGYSPASGVTLIEDKGFAFKDMNKNGKLDAWEDWRLSAEKRAEALAKELTPEQIAGLMLFSSHERAIEAGLTEEQKKYLKEDNLRAVLNAGSNNVAAAVQWNNEMQAFVESLDFPVPVNYSSDPRSTAGTGDQYSNMISGADISMWPSNLGLAATFDTDIMYQFAKDVSAEYRAMGITTALGPQIDLATEPRWLRVNGTFGENTQLSVDMTQASVDGSQSTYNAKGKDAGWGEDSINCMIKHWPGDGEGEAGRESHMESGKYGVYPGSNYEEHLKPFTLGGFKLKGKTKTATAVMDSYSIAIDKDGNAIEGGAVGSAYNKKKMSDLRDGAGFGGVVCTDWGVTLAATDEHFGMAWGEEERTTEERHYDALMNGIDMFGGNNDSKPILAAYEMMKKNMGEEAARARFELSAKRILMLIFNPALFENPYLDIERSKATAGSAEKRADGYNAQLSSIVMLKNKGGIIKADNKAMKEMTVYIPMTYLDSIPGPWGASEPSWLESMSLSIAQNYFKRVITDTPITDEEGNITGYETPDLSEVDMIIAGMSSPNNGSNFSKAGMSTNEDGTKTFYPLSLQYEPYTAKSGRAVSLGGDVVDGVKQNRCYNGETSKLYNERDYVSFKNAIAAKAGKEIPVIICMKAANPVCFGEIEKDADAILLAFSVSDQAFFDIVCGKAEPRGLLPMQMPRDMEAVEAQLEDVGQDMACYTDSEGNTYDFAFGLNYAGVINDARVKKYSKK